MMYCFEKKLKLIKYGGFNAKNKRARDSLCSG